MATEQCACGWTVHYDAALDELSLDTDQVRDLLHAFGVDADDLLSVIVTPEQLVVRRVRTNADGLNPTIVESVVTHR